MSVAGIYPVNGRGPHLSDREAALVDTLPETARNSRLASHAELHAAVVAMAERHGYSLELEVVGNGFTAVIGRVLRVVANVRGSGDETFYCQYDDETLSRQLAQELARTCGPQIVLPSTGDDGVLVMPPSS